MSGGNRNPANETEAVRRRRITRARYDPHPIRQRNSADWTDETCLAFEQEVPYGDFHVAVEHGAQAENAMSRIEARGIVIETQCLVRQSLCQVGVTTVEQRVMSERSARPTC